MVHKELRRVCWQERQVRAKQKEHHALAWEMEKHDVCRKLQVLPYSWSTKLENLGVGQGLVRR